MISHHRHHHRSLTTQVAAAAANAVDAAAAATTSVQSIDLLVQWNTYLTFELFHLLKKECSMFVH